jgi:hypothetical protein
VSTAQVAQNINAMAALADTRAKLVHTYLGTPRYLGSWTVLLERLLQSICLAVTWDGKPSTSNGSGWCGKHI